MTILPRRKRGGQPGNHNRLKHGLYARHFPIELELRPEDIGPYGQRQTVALCRARLKQLLDSQLGSDPKDFLTYERAIQYYLNVIGRLVYRNRRLARLLDTPSASLPD